MTPLRLSLCLFALSAATGLAQVEFVSSYTQNFDSLPASGSGVTFSLANWVVSDSTIDASTGSTATVGLKSLGVDSDRALGSLAADSTGTIYYGIQLFNSSGVVLPSITISYYGETWRRGSATSADPYGLDFAYSRSATSLTTGTYFNFDALDYISSVDVVVANPAASSDGYAINGNDAANRTLVTATLTFAGGWQPGQLLWLRWADANSNGFDSSIGIDDLVITTAVPEPAHYGLIVGCTLALLVVIRRRHRIRSSR